MRFRSTLAVLALSLLAMHPPLGAQTSASSNGPAMAAIFRTAIAWRDSAIVHRDTAKLHQLIADDLHFVTATSGRAMTAPQFLAAVGGSGSGPAAIDLDSVQARMVGTVAFVSYQRRDHYKMGSGSLTTSSSVLEIYALRHGRWLLTDHIQTWRTAAPMPVALDTTALDGFTGHYELAAGYVDQVTRVGDHLVATATGEPAGATLVPVSATVFRPEGVGTVTIFERDATGKVTGYASHLPDGQVLHARKID